MTSLQDLGEIWRTLNTNLSAKGRAPKTGWSDKNFAAEVKTYKKYKWLDIIELRPFYTAFLNSYFFGGLVDGGAELLLHVIMNMRNKDGSPLFKHAVTENKEEGLTAEYKLDPELKAGEEIKDNYFDPLSQDTTQVQDIQLKDQTQTGEDLADELSDSDKKSGETKSPEDVMTVLGERDVKLMYDWCKAILDQSISQTSTNTTQTQTKEVIQKYTDLSQVLGYCCLIILRLIVKTPAQLQKYFNVRASQTFRQLFTSSTFKGRIVPPEKTTLASLALNLNKTDPDVQRCYSQIVYHYYLYQNVEVNKQSVSILEAGIMIHTSSNGMGMITLFESLKNKYGLDDRGALSCILVSDTVTSCATLINFLKNYAKTDAPEITWRWARVIDDAYFEKLAVKHNKTLCYRMAASIAAEETGIWDMMDLKNCTGAQRRAAQLWAQALDEELAPKIDALVGFEDSTASKVISRLKKGGDFRETFGRPDRRGRRGRGGSDFNQDQRSISPSQEDDDDELLKEIFKEKI
uniref:Nucleoprotein n=1 Tax=Blattodean rhabdo-related virus OKIAV14 TaxID=2746364 RepID=A0A7D7JG01_9RHAB|nr:nucleocapsid protein [Blattodean rhabdo-related virus OKIAV14]